MGGGAVSYWAKAQGFQQVIANDISIRSGILATAFLTNQRVQLNKEDTLWLTQPLAQGPGWIEARYCPSVFSMRHARALDQGFYWAKQHPDPVKQALLLVLMWKLASDFVAFGSSLGTSNRPFAEALDGKRSWDSINPKRFTDGSLKRLCQPVWKSLETKRSQINGGVIGGSSVQVYQEDAISLLSKVQGDILYLDPPYAGTVSYEKANEVLDALLMGNPLSACPQVSAFSKNTETLNALLAQADHIPVWLLSYGGPDLSLEDLKAMVSVHAGPRIVEGYAKRYRHLSHVSKNKNNQELLVLAYPEGGMV
jgi:adenine-specific DNA methylase